MLQLTRLVIGIKPAVRMLDLLLRTVVPGIPLQDAVCRLVVTDRSITPPAVKTAESGIPVPEPGILRPRPDSKDLHHI